MNRLVEVCTLFSVTYYRDKLIIFGNWTEVLQIVTLPNLDLTNV